MTRYETIDSRSVYNTQIDFDGSIEITSSFYDGDGRDFPTTRTVTLDELEKLVVEARAHRDFCHGD